MPTFIIEGKNIVASSKEQALRYYTSQLKVIEEKDEYHEPLKSLNLEDWIKEGIVAEGDEDELNLPFCVINTTPDSEVCARGFKTKAQLDGYVRGHFEDPDDSSWSIDCVIMNGKVYTVKPTVSLEYKEKP